MREQQGHKGLERIGFDGAAIEKLRHLSGKQYEELLVILEQFLSQQMAAQIGYHNIVELWKICYLSIWKMIN